MPTVRDPQTRSSATPPHRPPPPGCAPRRNSGSPRHSNDFVFLQQRSSSSSPSLPSESVPVTPRGHVERQRHDESSRQHRRRASDPRRSSNARPRRSRPEITILSVQPMADHPAFADGDKGGFVPPEAPPSYEQAMRAPLPLNPTFTNPTVPDHVSGIRRVFPQRQIVNSSLLTVPSYSASVTSQPPSTVTAATIVSSPTGIVSCVVTVCSRTTSAQTFVTSSVISQSNPLPTRQRNHNNNITERDTFSENISRQSLQDTHPNSIVLPSTSSRVSPPRQRKPALPSKRPALKPKPTSSVARTTHSSQDSNVNNNSSNRGSTNLTESGSRDATVNPSLHSHQRTSIPTARTIPISGQNMSTQSTNHDIMSLFDTPVGAPSSLPTPLMPSMTPQKVNTAPPNNMMGFDLLSSLPQGGSMNNQPPSKAQEPSPLIPAQSAASTKFNSGSQPLDPYAALRPQNVVMQPMQMAPLSSEARPSVMQRGQNLATSSTMQSSLILQPNQNSASTFTSESFGLAMGPAHLTSAQTVTIEGQNMGSRPGVMTPLTSQNAPINAGVSGFSLQPTPLDSTTPNHFTPLPSQIMGASNIIPLSSAPILLPQTFDHQSVGNRAALQPTNVAMPQLGNVPSSTIQGAPILTPQMSNPMHRHQSLGVKTSATPQPGSISAVPLRPTATQPAFDHMNAQNTGMSNAAVLQPTQMPVRNLDVPLKPVRNGPPGSAVASQPAPYDSQQKSPQSSVQSPALAPSGGIAGRKLPPPPRPSSGPNRSTSTKCPSTKPPGPGRPMLSPKTGLASLNKPPVATKSAFGGSNAAPSLLEAPLVPSSGDTEPTGASKSPETMDLLSMMPVQAMAPTPVPRKLTDPHSPHLRKVPNLSHSGPNSKIEPVYAAVTKKRAGHSKPGEKPGASHNTGDQKDRNTPSSEGISLLDMLQPSNSEMISAKIESDPPPPLPATRPPLEDFEDLLTPAEMNEALAKREKAKSQNATVEDLLGFGSLGSPQSGEEHPYEIDEFGPASGELPHVKQTSTSPVMPAPRSKKNVKRTSDTSAGKDKPLIPPPLPKSNPKVPEGGTVVYSKPGEGNHSPEATLMVQKKPDNSEKLAKKLRRKSMRIKQSTMGLFRSNKSVENNSKTSSENKPGESPSTPPQNEPLLLIDTQPKSAPSKPPRPPGPPPPRPTSLPSKRASVSIPSQPLLSPTNPSPVQQTPMPPIPLSTPSQSLLCLSSPVQSLSPAQETAKPPAPLSAPSQPLLCPSAPVGSPIQQQPKSKPSKPPPPRIAPSRAAPARPPPKANTNQNNRIKPQNSANLPLPTPKPRSNSKTDPLQKESQPVLKTDTPSRPAPLRPHVKPSRPPPVPPPKKSPKSSATPSPRAVANSPHPAPKPTLDVTNDHQTSNANLLGGVMKQQRQNPQTSSSNLPLGGAKFDSPEISQNDDRIEVADGLDSGLTATVIYDFSGSANDELSFKIGDKVSKVMVVDDNWYKGWLGGKSGIFPKGFIVLDSTQNNLHPNPAPAISPTFPTWDDDAVEPDAEVAQPSPIGESPELATPDDLSHHHTPSSDGCFDVKDKFENAVTKETITDSNPNSESAAQPNAMVAEPDVSIATSTVRRTSVALFPFTGQDDSELTFDEGQTINITGIVNEEWLTGELEGKQGMFPAAYVREQQTPGEQDKNTKDSSPTFALDDNLHEPQSAPTNSLTGFEEPMAKGVKDYDASSGEEISFKVNDVLFLLEQVDPDWLMVQHDQSGAVGRVPVSHVTVIHPLPEGGESMSWNH